MSRFNQLTDKEKIQLSADYVARGVKLPEELRIFLEQHNLLDAVLNPKGKRS
jgi:hypothetical protein